MSPIQPDVGPAREPSRGLPTAQQKPFQKAFSDVNDFFPHGATIRVGDSIKFVPTGFHSVDIPRKGGSALALILPTGQPIAAVNDAAGAAFWFNGQQQVGFNPQLGPLGLFVGVREPRVAVLGLSRSGS